MSKEAYLSITIRDAETGRILKHKIKKCGDVLEALVATQMIGMQLGME